MKCEEIRDELIAYVKGELSVELGAEIDEHLARCHGCQRELETARRVLAQTETANEASVIRMANEIIMKGIEAGASDIHLDPVKGGMEIRYRIDGVLQPDKMLSQKEQEAVTARIRMIADLPLTENQVPQDGRIPVRRDGRDYDVRVSIVPSIFGLKIAMRILDQTITMLGLEKLGFLPEQLEMVRNLSHQPNGMIVVTGPSGSGKTTTLYSMLVEIIDPGISIVTVEDPVEYQLQGVQQTQVHVKAGLTFASALRSFLRQDPDVIMVGQIRCLETGEIAMEAAVTGHLVLSALHTQDAPSAPIRMVDMGMESYLVGQTLIAVIAQRLVRKVCQDCREEYTPSSEALDFLGLRNQAGNARFYHGRGCETCRGTGYRGRTALVEVLEIDRELGRMISDGKDADALAKRASEKGFVTMSEVARKKVLEGITTAEEAHRVLERR